MDYELSDSSGEPKVDSFIYINNVYFSLASFVEHGSNSKNK